MVLVVPLLGCQTARTRSQLPSQEQVIREQLIVHSDFHLPKQHRLLDELVARGNDISNLLAIPTSDEPINIYLFDDQTHFQEFMVDIHPAFPNRRAFFVKDDTSLSVYAFWGSRVGEDLRHEVTHGYLHSVVPNLPLWLDEGIAEYFEVARGKKGINGPHVYHLSNALRRGQWKPNLARLELIESASELTQMDYAESWLWIHFLLTTDSESREIIRNHLARLRSTATPELMMPIIAESIPDCEARLIDHLKMLEDKNSG